MKSFTSTPVSRFHTFTPILRVVHVMLILALLAPVTSALPPVAPATVQAATNTDLTYTYDDVGRLTGIIDPATSTAIYQYDAVGNVLSIAQRASVTQVGVVGFSASRAAPNTTVTIYGTGFSATAAQNTVQFNGTAATVSSATSTELVVTVPSGATTGAVTVTTPSGSATSSIFTVLPAESAPAISSVSPTIGLPGTAVTITGANFTDVALQNKVRVNGTLALVTANTASALTVQLPSVATSGRVKVTTAAGSILSSADVFVPPAAFVAADVAYTGRATLGQATTVSVGTASKIGLLLFDGTIDQRISINVSNATKGYNLTVIGADGRILGPDDQIAGAVGVGTNSFINTFTLRSSGSQTILIDPNGTDTVDTTLTIYDVPPDVSGAITPGGAAVSTSTSVPGQKVNLSFNGTANQRVSVLVNNANKAYKLRILKPDGTQLSVDDVGTNTFIDTQMLPADGVYTLQVDPNNADIINTTLTLYNVPTDASGTISPGGAAVSTSTTVPGQNANLTFTASANQRISVLVNNANKAYTLRLLKPDGTQQSSTGANTNGFWDTQTLTTAGTYTLQVDPSNADTINTTITLYDVPSDANSTITPGGATASIDTTVSGQNANLTFTGAANQRISVLVNSANKAYTLRLIKPDGTQQSSTGANTNIFWDTQTLATAGTYTLRVDPNGADLINTTITLYDVPPDASGTITPGGAAASISTAVSGQNANLTFTGAANQRISVLVNSANKAYTLRLIKPDGTQQSSTGANTNTFWDTQTLATAGTYTLRVDPNGADLINTTITLYDVPPDASGTITPGGAAASISTAVSGQNANLTFTGAANQRISVLVNSANKAYTLRLIKPDGTQQSSTGANTNTFWDTQTLATAGTYSLRVDPNGLDLINTSITLYDVPPNPVTPIIVDGPSVSTANTVSGQNADLTFTAVANQRVSIGINSTSKGYTLRLLKPDGTQQTSWGANTNSTLGPVTLATAGTYTLRVDPSGADVINTTLTLVNAPSAFAPQEQASTGNTLSESSAPLTTFNVRFAPPVPATPPDTTPITTTDGTILPPELALPELELERRAGSEAWTPPTIAGREWRTGRGTSRWADLPPLKTKPGETALAGQVLRLNGLPLANVTLEIDEHTIRTDRTGRFLLTGLSSGSHELKIDGASANKGKRTYGFYEAHITLEANITNVLPYTIWMTPLDTQHTVRIPSPTTSEVVLTTPAIPGLEVHIPKGAVITGEDGKVITEVGITAIPVDRPPFPLPKNTEIPIYFTVQPGGAYVSTYAQIVYPNYNSQPPGERTDFWNYDPEEKEWFIYGHGAVTPNGKQVAPDANTKIYEFSGAMFSSGRQPPATAPVQDESSPDSGSGDGSGGDPVDLYSGLFVMNEGDLILPDALPIVLGRTYRTNDTANRAFGVGMTFAYDMFVWSAKQYEQADLILPDGGRIHYDRISSGTGWTDAVFEHTATASVFYKSRIVWNGDGWDVVLRNGTVYVIGENAPLQAIRDRYGNQVTINRVNRQTGNITRIRSSNGRWIAFQYGTGNRISQAQDSSGRTVSYQYDTAGRMTKVTYPNNTFRSYTYDTNGRMKTLTDERGITFLSNEYDSNGRVSKQTLADGNTYLFAYTLDANGKATQTDVTDPRGFVRRAAFNSAGYRTSDTVALGTPQQQSVTYERQVGTNQLLSVTDPLGRKTSYTYDAQGNVLSVTRLADTANAVTTNFTYDSRFSQLATVRDPLNHTTTFSYNDKGSLVRIVNPLGYTSIMTYTTSGLLAAATGPLGRTSQQTYDDNDPVAITDPLGRTLTQYNDAAGRIVRMTTPLGQRMTYEYDVMNRPLSATNPLGAVTRFAYNQIGNLLSLTDAKNHTTSYTYDARDRVLTRTDPLSRTEQYAYDANSNLVRVTDRKGQITTFQYDPLGRATLSGFGTSGTEPNLNFTSTVTATYDMVNRLVATRDTLHGTLRYGYDTLDRLQSETSPQGTVSYGYDAADRQTSMTVAGQPIITYAYDNANRITGLTQDSTTVGVAYDNAGRRSTLTLPNGVQIGYGYDNADQLTGLTYTKGATTLGDLQYTYDALGRRTHMRGSLARTNFPTPVSSAAYDAANQLTQWNSATLTYDANGNMTSDGAATYTWNNRDQLVGLQSSGTTASFQYDAAGRRAAKTINGITTRFLYDGANIVQELNGTTPTANLLMGGTDEVFARTDSAGRRVPLTDGLGSPLDLTDDTGAVKTSYTYDPFGKTTATGDASTNSFQFAGRENDGTGLYYNRARYYNPGLQRFISQDPSNFAGSGTNWYSYAGNNPISYTDPSGRFPVMLITGAVGAVTAVAGNLLSQLYSNNWNLDCVRWTDVIVAGTVGFISGMILSVPMAPVRAAIIGAVSNIIQYVATQIINGGDINPQDLLWSGLTGFGAGFVGGTFSRGRIGIGDKFSRPGLRFDENSPSLGRIGRALNNQIDIAANTGVSNLLRSFGAGGISNLPSSSNQASCGC